MKKTIKKILIAMCLITMTAAAAACGNNNAASSSSSSAGSSGVQQTVFNERATEKDTEATESSTKATEKGTEKATEKKSGTGFGSSKSDKDKKSKSSKSDKDKKSNSSKSDKDKKSSSSKSDKKNNENKNNSSGNGGEITYYYTTTTTGGSTGSSGDNSSAPSQNSSSGGNSSSKNNNSGSTGKSNGKSNNSSSSQADPHAGKTWHEAEYKVINHPAETEKVWVVDQPATTKEEPVYETHDVTICNVCGADITNAAYREQHLIAHIEAGEGGSYHNEWREIQVGTKTVTVPEKGHWEKRIVKPAWTEKKLVREAGWY